MRAGRENGAKEIEMAERSDINESSAYVRVISRADVTDALGTMKTYEYWSIVPESQVHLAIIQNENAIIERIRHERRLWGSCLGDFLSETVPDNFAIELSGWSEP
jgi:hypothetical protein